MTKRQKLLFITSTNSYGGAEKHLIEIIVRLDPARTEAVILCLLDDVFSQRLSASVEVKRTSIKGPAGYAWAFARFRADVVVFVKTDLNTFPWHAFVAAKTIGFARVIAIEHCTPDTLEPAPAGAGLLQSLRRLIGWRARHLLGVRVSAQATDLMVCVSAAVQSVLVHTYGVAEIKTKVVRNGADMSEHRPERDTGASRARWGLSPDHEVIACVARLARMKRIDLLLDAMVRVVRERPSCVCLIAGSGPLERELKLLCSTLGLGDSVRFLGFQADVKPLLQTSDLFVLSSDSREGLSLALLEAVACGLPAVVTDVGGATEAVVDGVTGVVVRPGSADALAEGILAVLRDRRALQEMGAQARLRAERLFDLDRNMRQIVVLLAS